MYEKLKAMSGLEETVSSWPTPSFADRNILKFVDLRHNFDSERLDAYCPDAESLRIFQIYVSR